MVEDWREKWNCGDFPVYFVQLPGYIQAQIRARKQQPATLEDLKRMANEVKQLF